MSKAGKGDGVDTGTVGSEHPVPENIPHLASPAAALALGPGSPNGLHLHALHGPGALQAGSPVKESSFLHRETSADEVDDDPAKPAGPLRAMAKEVTGPAAPQLKAPGPSALRPQQGKPSEGIPIRR